MDRGNRLNINGPETLNHLSDLFILSAAREKPTHQEIDLPAEIFRGLFRHIGHIGRAQPVSASEVVRTLP